MKNNLNIRKSKSKENHKRKIRFPLYKFNKTNLKVIEKLF